MLVYSVHKEYLAYDMYQKQLNLQESDNRTTEVSAER